MSKEAMKLALEALEAELDPSWNCNSYHPKIHTAMTALREALAEQPAQDDPDLQDKDPELVEQPAQHEPFTHYRHYDNGLQDWADEKTIPLYTFPPAQRTWVGLTEEEKRQLFDREDYQGWLDYINAIEAKLKEKNA